MNVFSSLVYDNSLTETVEFFSSFNDKPLNEAAVGPIGKELFEREQEDLLSDLNDIPKKACDRRVSWVLSCSVLSLNIATVPCNTTFYNCRLMNLLSVREQPRFMLI